MLVFPQLMTGASAMYPVTRKTQMRTVVNELDDGRAVVFFDPDGGRREWELRATGLTADEWQAIEALFISVSGRWKTFTFLDPAGNLLSQSEDFSNAVWTVGPLVTLTSGAMDPLGTSRATTAFNSGAAVEGVTQTLAVPGGFQYSLSIWARSTAGSFLTLMATSGSSSKSLTVVAQSIWQRLSLPVTLEQTAEESVTFGVQIPVGSTVDLFGAQVEAQPGVSDYKMTGSQGGVWGKARFNEDELKVRAQGTDVFDAVIDIVTVGA